MEWRDHLTVHLQEMQPASVCTLDAASHLLAGSALPNAVLHPHVPLPAVPCAMALGIDALNGLDVREAEQLICRIRIYAAPRLLLTARASCRLDEAAFRALGFTLALTDPAEDVRIYHYDLDTYKTVPDWLNARFWAHPERWEP